MMFYVKKREIFVCHIFYEKNYILAAEGGEFFKENFVCHVFFMKKYVILTAEGGDFFYAKKYVILAVGDGHFYAFFYAFLAAAGGKNFMHFCETLKKTLFVILRIWALVNRTETYQMVS